MLRKIAIGFWLAVLLSGLTAYLVWPERFTPQGIAAFIADFHAAALFAFALFSMLRGFTLLPSTPLVIAGTLLFPGQPWIVLFVSVVGILISSSVIYWLSDLLGIAEYLESNKPEKVAAIRQRLEHPTGLLFVILWAVFPLVPTDAVCYVAGSMRMNFPKFIGAVLIGETVLCSIYIFSIVSLIF